MSQTLSEFDLIARFFDVQALTGPSTNPFVSLSIGDDCAILRPSPHTDMTVSVDTLVSGVHFLPSAPADLLAWRALAVSASDLAAMGSTPKGFTLALTLPEANEAWLADYARGLAEAAAHYGMVLFGGDTTRGPLSMTLQVFGEVPQGQPIRRDGAQEGDAVYVSHDLGAAHAALPFLSSNDPDETHKLLLQAYYQPLSCVQLGQALRGIASAAIDVSDGLLADLAHIAKRSKVAIDISSYDVPINSAVSQISESSEALQAALTGGDDYQLAFCVPQEKEALLAELPFTITRIGQCRVGEGVYLDGQRITGGGYQHFKGSHD